MDPFVGQLMLVPYNFAPRGWAFCQGQLISISQNTALFSLLGTMYGGNGQTTFALPDLQGRVPIGKGQGPGLSDYLQGEESGEASVSLIISEIPFHTHSLMANTALPGASQAAGNAPAKKGMYLNPATPASFNAQLHPTAMSIIGGNQPHENQMPTLTMNWIIAMQGVFPSRS
jgi:microcystin-dependent protein